MSERVIPELIRMKLINLFVEKNIDFTYFQGEIHINFYYYHEVHQDKKGWAHPLYDFMLINFLDMLRFKHDTYVIIDSDH